MGCNIKDVELGGGSSHNALPTYNVIPFVEHDGHIIYKSTLALQFNVRVFCLGIGKVE